MAESRVDRLRGLAQDLRNEADRLEALADDPTAPVGSRDCIACECVVAAL